MAEKKENVQKEIRRIQMTPEIAKNLINMSRQNLSAVLNRKAQVEQALISLDSTIANISALEENKEEEGMINLGSGVYVPLKFPTKITTAKFMIGNDILLDKPFSEIKKVLEERRTKFQKEYEVLVKQEAELSDNLNKLYFYINSLARAQRAKE